MTKFKPYSEKYRDWILRYDLDYPGRQIFIRQRTYIGDSQFYTPVTNTLLRRLVSIDEYRPPKAKLINARYVNACYENPNNKGNTTIRQVIIPFRPTDPNHRLQIQEVLEYFGVYAATYAGESFKDNTLRFLGNEQRESN
ncbi:MAG: hypothetical protein KME17_08155 [Cyanosarcina radialis HA8281-LM2]|jgi:hypothetical protein|nr:hypothetical protein [Cyanosarcina radialis HA8281-LM2]